MRILITGASGLLGVRVLMEAASAFPSAKVYGTFNTCLPEITASYADNITMKKVNFLCSEEVTNLMREVQPDWVIHCVAMTAVDLCETESVLAERLNVECVSQLMSQLKSTCRFIYISTDCVFDGRRGSYTEEDVPAPLNVYAKTKLAGEAYVLQENLRHFVLRTNLFGQMWGKQVGLACWIIDSLKQKKIITGFTDVFFNPLSTDELARIICHIIAYEVEGGLYHLGALDSCHKYDFIYKLATIFSLDTSLVKKGSVSSCSFKAARPLNTTLVTKKAETAFGPMPTLEHCLKLFFSSTQNMLCERLA